MREYCKIVVFIIADMIIDKEYIIKVIEHKLPEGERKAFFDKVVEDSVLSDLYTEVKNEYTMENLPNSPEGTVFYEQFKKKNSKGNNIKFLTYLTRVAAILFIPLCIYFIYNDLPTLLKKEKSEKSFSQIVKEQHESMSRYYVHNGTKGFIEFPDGSKVWLNSGSQLEFPTRFSGSSRVATLSGEGYFEIVSNKEWPFYIKTPKGITIKVTGTSFNLSCYEDDPAFKLSMLTGSLVLERDTDRSRIDVSQNEEIVIADKSLSKNQIIKSKLPEEIETATAWKDGSLIFDDVPMDEVIKKVERWFGVTIFIANPNILQFRYTAEFKEESITQVLDAIKVTSNISYTIKGKDVKLY